MEARNNTVGRTARRTTAVAATLLLIATGTAAAHGGSGGGAMGGGAMGGGAMGGGAMGGGWGTFGGAMGLWGLLWMGLLLAVPLLLVYALVGRDSGARADRPFRVLRERYAQGELSHEEYERRRERLQQAMEAR